MLFKFFVLYICSKVQIIFCFLWGLKHNAVRDVMSYH